jgi:penicillin-binding protein 1A
VVDKGTGSAIRTRFGIRGDVAGKTGTTQDDADGWFILMHPQLVAGAWVGFNDSRVTLRSDYWGQGAHSALPLVGDFFQRALRSRLIDPRAKFVEEKQTGVFDSLRATVSTWWGHLFGADNKPVPQRETPRAPRRAPATVATPAAPAAPAPVASASAEPRDVEPPQIVAPHGASVPPLLSPPGAAAGAQNAQGAAAASGTAAGVSMSGSAAPAPNAPGTTPSGPTSLDQWINQHTNGEHTNGAAAPSGGSGAGSQ